MLKSFLYAGVVFFSSLTVGCNSPSFEQKAKDMLKNTDFKGGLIVHLGCGNGRLTAAFYQSQDKGIVVHGLDKNVTHINKARKYIQSKNIYGPVSVEHLQGDKLAYTDHCVNLVIAENLYGVSMDEIMRVLCPQGMAYIKNGSKWEKYIKDWPDEIDEWTHYLHGPNNNAVAHDNVGPPRHLQWIGKPLYCRSHEVDASLSALVSANGRLFYILDENLPGIKDPRLPPKWSLIARDAFNGVLLWKRPLPQWGWRQWKKELAGMDWTELRGQRVRFPITLPRRLVAKDDHVYVTLGYRAPVTVLDAATGELFKQLEQSRATDEILCYQNKIVLCIRQNPEKVKSQAERPDLSESVLTLDVSSDKVLWEKKEDRILPLSLAVENSTVFYCNTSHIIATDLKTGRERWRTAVKSGQGGLWGVGETLVAKDDVVLFLSRQKLLALSSKTGDILWTRSGDSGPSSGGSDLFVTNGLVWYGGPLKRIGTREWLANESVGTSLEKAGYDLMTGIAQKKVKVENLLSPGHHFRCYRSKATDRFIMWTKRGAEFIDLKCNSHMRHDWLRASCRLGFMPCNGLLYVPPHQCFCYREALLNGFNALAHTLDSKRWPLQISQSQRLEKGSAYDDFIEPVVADKDEWPMYRHDSKRSGSVDSNIPFSLQQLWTQKPGGKLSQPVIVDGKLYVASVNSHRVLCCNAKTGERLWQFTAGGRVDSSPTFYQGRVLFGSGDGRVYCLRADTGELIWKFQAAPRDRRIMVFGQLESAWPVHGSVLIKDDVAYVVAGRSSFVDHGIFVYGLNPVTGQVMCDTHIEGPYPKIPNDIGRPFDMDGALSDILVSHDDFIYMRNIKFDKKLNILDEKRQTQLGNKKIGRHLFSTSSSGLLDDTWWDRTFWMYAETWPGFYFGHYAPKSGQILVFDDSTTFGVKCYTERNVHSPMFRPGSGYLVYADRNDTEPVLVDSTRSPSTVKWMPSPRQVWAHRDLDYNDVAVNYEKGPGFSRTIPPKWTQRVPVRGRALLLSKDWLFIAGPPDIVDPEDPLAAFNGRLGANLWVLSVQHGNKQAGYKLPAPPVFDGMVAAKDRLYIATTEGEIVCFGPK